MQDEILKKAYTTDTARIPRYRLVDKNGNVLYEGVELQLLNEIEQAGTPYSKSAVLPDDLAAEVCPDVDNPTPADALRTLNADVIKSTAQELTEDQQAQARDNVGVHAEVWTFTLVDDSVVEKVVYVG